MAVPVRRRQHHRRRRIQNDQGAEPLVDVERRSRPRLLGRVAYRLRERRQRQDSRRIRVWRRSEDRRRHLCDHAEGRRAPEGRVLQPRQARIRTERSQVHEGHGRGRRQERHARAGEHPGRRRIHAHRRPDQPAGRRVEGLRRRLRFRFRRDRRRGACG